MSDEGSVGALNGQRLNDGNKYDRCSQKIMKTNWAMLCLCNVHL